MSRLRRFSVCWISALLLVAGFHVAVEDFLLFRSDVHSLTVYLIAASASVLMAVLLVAGLLALALRRTRIALYEWFAVAVAASIVVAFLVLLVGLVRTKFQLGVLLDPLIGMATLGAIYAGFVAAAPLFVVGILVLAFLKRKRLSPAIPVIVERVENVGLMLLVFVLLGVPVTAGMANILFSSTDESVLGREPTHLLLLVIDGFPASYAHAYSSEAAPGEFDLAISKGKVFRQMRTARPYTPAFFATIYTGRNDFSVENGNLFQKLQRNGVAVQLISYHENGFPEGSMANIGGYRGLRSALLNHNFTWIPQILGLDYHLALWHRPSGIFGKGFLSFLNKRYDTNIVNPFSRILLPELRRIQRDHSNSFTLFHIGHQLFLPRAVGSMPQAQFSGGEEPENIAKIRRNDYQYGAEDEDLAAELRTKEQASVDALGKELADFLAILSNDDGINATSVVLTADHGSIHAKGRFWYGFHPNEEVIRVPLVVFDGNSRGYDDRLLTTQDINASVLGFFGARLSADSESVSVFDNKSGRLETTTLTMRSDRHSEWFLIRVNDSAKRVYNLHPASDGAMRVFKINEYHETQKERVTSFSDKERGEIKAWLKEFGVVLSEVHLKFR